VHIENAVGSENAEVTIIRGIMFATTIRWHRRAFAYYWTKKSRRHSRRPEVAAEIRDLIRRMSQAEPVVRTTPHSRGTELHHRHLRRARLVGPRSKPVAPTFGFLEWKYRLSLIYRKR
jgi:hypothetical protein